MGLDPQNVKITDVSKDKLVKQLFKAGEKGLINSPNEVLRLNKIEKAKKSKKVTIVTLPDDLYKEHLLSFYFDVPKREIKLKKSSSTKQIIIKRKEISSLSDTKYVWSGVLVNIEDQSEVGDATFIVNSDNELTGSIDLEGTFYDVRSLGKSGRHALVKLDMEHLSKSNKNDVRKKDTTKSKATEFEKQRLNQPPLQQSSVQSGPRCTPEYQSVIALYTANAASGRNINDVISLAVQEANESYNYSQVSNMRLRVAHKQQISFIESTEIEDDLARFKSSSSVNNLRNQYQADLVLLITDSYYSAGFSGVYTGLADTILANANSAYALVEADYATAGSYTFAHEVGHLQGAQHHPDDDVDPNGPFSFGFGHRFTYRSGFLGWVKNYRSTIMAYTPGNYRNIKRFSNPNVTYSGKATGISGQRENYRVLKQTAASLADFRNPNEFRATVSITAYPTQFSNVSFTANTCGGSGSYSYAWQISQDPFNYGSIQSTSQTFSPALAPGVWYTKLTTSTGTGQQVVAYSGIQILEECDDPSQIFCEELPLLKANTLSEESPDNIELLSAYPNPFNPTTQVSFTLKEPQKVNVSIYDVAGREVAVLVNDQKAAGTHVFTFDAGDLSSGVYIIQLRTPNSIQSQKITLLK